MLGFLYSPRHHPPGGLVGLGDVFKLGLVAAAVGMEPRVRGFGGFGWFGGLGFRVWGLGIGGFRVWGLGFRVWGLGFGV